MSSKTLPMSFRVPLSYPDIDFISVIPIPFGTVVEIAFFRNGAWVLTPVKEFAGYAESTEGDTLVYTYVPAYLVDAFIERWKA